MKNFTADEKKRFTKFINKKENGCWEWSGYKDKDGYGTMVFRRKPRRAHRVSWYAFNGIVGDDMVIHHKCKNRACVNPNHLERITKIENQFADSNSVGAINRKKNHCKYGHLFDRKYGKQRYCSICQANKTKRLRAKWKLNPLLKGV